MQYLVSVELPDHFTPFTAQQISDILWDTISFVPRGNIMAFGMPFTQEEIYKAIEVNALRLSPENMKRLLAVLNPPSNEETKADPGQAVKDSLTVAPESKGLDLEEAESVFGDPRYDIQPSVRALGTALVSEVRRLRAGAYSDRDHIFTPWQKDPEVCGLCGKGREGHGRT